MNPKEFKKRVQELINTYASTYELETLHTEYDELLESVLIDLGYQEGIDLMEDIDLWYA